MTTTYRARSSWSPTRRSGNWGTCRARGRMFHPWLYPPANPHVQISQEEVAALAGVSRPRCNCALKDLEELGLLRWSTAA